MLLVVLVAVCFQVTLVKADCVAGWTQYGGSCYHLSHDTETWADALIICKMENAYLAEISDEQENAFIQRLVASGIGKRDAWIGGNDLFVEGQWIWEESRSDLTEYSNFNPGEPNNWHHNEHCMDIVENGKWNDDHCTNMQQYICEKNAVDFTIIG